MFNSVYNKKQHRDVVHQKRPYICPACSKTFWTNDQAITHSCGKHGISKKCVAKFTIKKDDHWCDIPELKERTEALIKASPHCELKTKVTPKKQFPCGFRNCQQIFSSNHDKKNHRDAIHQKRPCICPACSKTFSTNNQTIRHLYGKHGISRTLGKKLPIKYDDQWCDILELVERTETEALVTASLQYELKTKVNTNGKFPCGFKNCQLMFKLDCYKQNHRDAVHRMRPFICPTCSKTFDREKQVIYHLNKLHGIHTKLARRTPIKNLDYFESVANRIEPIKAKKQEPSTVEDSIKSLMDRVALLEKRNGKIKIE